MKSKDIHERKIPSDVRKMVVLLLRPHAPHVEEWMEKLISDPEAQEERAVNYMTRSDVAQRLKISLPSVDRLLASGELPHCKIRRLVRISEEDLSEYLAHNRA